MISIISIWNQIERGIIGDGKSFEYMGKWLFQCRYENDIAQFQRMCNRLQYATEPKPEWMTWDELYLITQN